MRIAVYGAGAIGGSLGGFLASAGEDVLLVDPWREHVAAMQRQGLVLEGTTGEQRASVTAIHSSQLGEVGGVFDVVVVAVKSYDTVAAVHAMLPYMHDETWVVTPQNGLNELQIGPLVGARRVLGCVTTIAAELVEPARVRRTMRTGSDTKGGGDQPVCFIVGELDGRITPRLQRLAALLQPAGRTVTTTELWGERWTKLAINAMVNPMAAATGLAGYDLKANDRARHLLYRLGIETVKVARALGYRAEVPVGGFTLQDFEQAVAGSHAKLDEAFIGVRPTVPGRPSMGQDVLKGRPTEIRYINGEVAAHGVRIGVPTPCCDAAVEVVTRIERGELTSSVDNIALLESLAGAPAG
jgi:2-dehydropantoate 2-reductase